MNNAPSSRRPSGPTTASDSKYPPGYSTASFSAAASSDIDSANADPKAGSVNIISSGGTDQAVFGTAVIQGLPERQKRTIRPPVRFAVCDATAKHLTLNMDTMGSRRKVPTRARATR